MTHLNGPAQNPHGECKKIELKKAAGKRKKKEKTRSVWGIRKKRNSSRKRDSYKKVPNGGNSGEAEKALGKLGKNIGTRNAVLLKRQTKSFAGGSCKKPKEK